MEPVYLDHAATSPLRPEALQEFVAASGLVGNASSLHRPGQRARRRLEEAREELAAVVGAGPSEVIFTSGGSEADTIGVLGGWEAGRARGRGRCLVSAVEHPAVKGAVSRGAEVLPVGREGVVDLGAVAAALDASVAVVSVMWVNNETGVVQPVGEVGELAAASGAWMHTDAVQALGHVALDFGASGVDLMSLSAHKIGGPVGVGALVSRREVVPAAVGLGGGQEREIRSGTQPVALAAAFARAASVAVGELEAEVSRLTALRDRVAAVSVAAGGRLNSWPRPAGTGAAGGSGVPPQVGAPHIVNVTFDGVRADDLLFLLDQRGVAASVGSACKAGVHQPSEVLLAMGRTPVEATQSLRFSLGWTTTSEDIDRLVEVLPEALAVARSAF
ncbi:cysteine desulfurase family protein [Tessaracoccus sp. G1721]